MSDDGLLASGYVGHIFIKGRVPAFEVVVGMIADRMTGRNDLRKDIRVLVNILTHHEERSLDAIAIEDSEDLRCDLRDRTVIEGEIDRAGTIFQTPCLIIG